MIKLIKETNTKNLKLKAIFSKKDLNKNIIESHGKITLIDSEKTLYVYFKEEKLSFCELHKWIKTFTKCNQKDLDIDVNSFINKNLDEELALQAILEGTLFSQHNAVNYKTSETNKIKAKYNIIYNKANGEEIFNLIKIKLESVNLTRDLQDEAPNIMIPEKFVEKIQQTFEGIDNSKITILNKKEIEKEKMGLLLSVAEGSHNEPRVLVIEYIGDSNTNEKVGLVGKGITFDSGGYSLKPSNSMINMKFDMSGAAIVCSTMLAIAKLKPKINLVAVACLTENRIGGHATLVESVITSMNGKTVEILNTDAEGRLVLADGITYAIRKKQATKIIEASTLTGSILITLGHHATGVFSNDNKFYDEFEKATKLSKEKIWRLPIFKENLEEMNSEVADLGNIGTTKYMGSSQAAAFLEAFVEEKPFIHLDIAGTAFVKNRGTGVIVKTLIELFKK